MTTLHPENPDSKSADILRREARRLLDITTNVIEIEKYFSREQLEVISGKLTWEQQVAAVNDLVAAGKLKVEDRVDVIADDLTPTQDAEPLAPFFGYGVTGSPYVRNPTYRLDGDVLVISTADNTIRYDATGQPLGAVDLDHGKVTMRYEIKRFHRDAAR